MADKTHEKPIVAAVVSDAPEVPASDAKPNEPAVVAEGEKGKTGTEADKEAAPKEDASSTEATKDFKSAETSDDKKDDGKAEPANEDSETKDATASPKAESTAAAASSEQPASGSAAADTPANKNKGRRKSAAGESKGKTLSKKNSKARLTHLNAKPGDHFLVKLKGFPAWPAVVCDESMLPLALVNSRPVTAARPDGTYTEAYADGGKRMHDRSFPVMYLHTNEFGWVNNTSLSELTPEKASETITDKMRKDLKEAFQLAAKNHPIEHYKEILKSFQEELIAHEEARREAAATPKKQKKGKAKAADNEDVEMADADNDVKESAKAKKRKADDEVSTPQRPESVKKPKIKLNTSSTPKTANGATPKSKDGSEAKPKSKSKKGSDKKTDTPKEPKEPKMTPEERHARKEKEVLYLRHKLQRGLLTRDQQPQETEMKSMSDYVQLLENFKDLEVSIIRATKINKVLKAILKLESIPKEDEFRFKERSHALLEKWNKLLAGDGTPAPGSGATNGVNGTAEPKTNEKKGESNGVKQDKDEAKKAQPEKGAEDKAEDQSAKGEKSAEPTSDTPMTEEKTETAATSEPVEATA